MKRISSIAACFAFAVIFSVSAFAQTPADGKIGLINTYAFGDEKGGIAKYKTALKMLDDEFKPTATKLNGLGTRYQALGAEIQKLNATPANPQVPINQGAMQAKVDEFRALETQIKREQEDAKAKQERRYQEVVGPVFNDIIRALTDYAKTKGYAVILDGAKLEEANILLGFNEKYDVTDDFIAYYNARPAGAATASTPR